MASSPRTNICKRGLRIVTSVAILFAGFAFSTLAQAPTLTGISPPSFENLGDTSVTVTLTGTGFDINGTTIQLDPPGIITADPPDVTSATSATVKFTVNQGSNPQWVKVSVRTNAGVSRPRRFYPGFVDSTCLDAIQTGGCALRLEVEASSATGDSSQTNHSTTPNILVKLDYEMHPPKNRNLVPQSQNSTADHLAVHATFITGYTQTVATTKVQQTTSPGGTTTSTTCPGGTTTTSSTCTTAVPQQAYVADAAARVGWSTGVDGQGTFAEFGLGARGSFQYLIPTDRIVQSGGLTYIDLSSTNPHNAVGFYEGTAHFRLSQIGHAKTLASGATDNTSSILVVEAGYQNNRGLQNLAANPATNTRNRYVARFYITPELPSTKHTQLTVGMEYSGGIDGGPHVVQLFFGTNVNPAKLFGKGST